MLDFRFLISAWVSMGPSSFCSLMQELHMCALPAPVGAVTLISSIKIIQFHWIKKKKSSA